MSTLRVNTIQNSGGTGSPAINGLAAAWVNFNGTGTVAIRASSNVSSITDGGTGQYTVNFTTALADTNFSCITSDDNYGVGGALPTSTTSCLVVSRNNSFVLADTTTIMVSVFR